MVPGRSRPRSCWPSVTLWPLGRGHPDVPVPRVADDARRHVLRRRAQLRGGVREPRLVGRGGAHARVRGRGRRPPAAARGRIRRRPATHHGHRSVHPRARARAVRGDGHGRRLRLARGDHHRLRAVVVPLHRRRPGRRPGVRRRWRDLAGHRHHHAHPAGRTDAGAAGTAGVGRRRWSHRAPASHPRRAPGRGSGRRGGRRLPLAGRLPRVRGADAGRAVPAAAAHRTAAGVGHDVHVVRDRPRRGHVGRAARARRRARRPARCCSCASGG